MFSFRLIKYLLICVWFGGLVSCSSDHKVSLLQQAGNEGFHPLTKLFVVGDFNGDHLLDTLKQSTYSALSNKEIEMAPDPFQHEWDTVVSWFYEQDANVCLTMGKWGKDSIRFGVAHGLYCLLNIGDNNKDGKDEVAVVVDWLDYTSVNRCRILSLCNDKWVILKEFYIHEDAFNFTNETRPVFAQINEYLEPSANGWLFNDYDEQFSDEANPDMIGKLRPLSIERCNN